MVKMKLGRWLSDDFEWVSAQLSSFFNNNILQLLECIYL